MQLRNTKKVAFGLLAGLAGFAAYRFYRDRSNVLRTVSKVELEKYAGKWYEIARIPSTFEQDLVNTTATYSLREDGNMEVINEGRVLDPSGELKQTQALAWLPNANEPGKLKVRFFGLFTTDYWILDLDGEYQYALVGSPTRKFLWILSRTPSMRDDIYRLLVAKAKAKGFDVDELERVVQDYKSDLVEI